MRRPPTRKELGLEPRYTAKKFRPYALAIGEATLSWNDLHVELGMLFLTVSGGGSANYFFEIWNSLRNDGAKRDILMAAAKVSLNPTLERDQRAFEGVKWIVQRVGELVSDRNTVAHASLTFDTNRKQCISECMAGRPLRAEIGRLRHLGRVSAIAGYRYSAARLYWPTSTSSFA